jgi:hypothetical protein
MPQIFFNMWSVVNDFGQWFAIGGLAVFAYRSEMRAREKAQR